MTPTWTLCIAIACAVTAACAVGIVLALARLEKLLWEQVNLQAKLILHFAEWRLDSSQCYDHLSEVARARHGQILHELGRIAEKGSK
jgi:hypothetical protein